MAIGVTFLALKGGISEVAVRALRVAPVVEIVRELTCLTGVAGNAGLAVLAGFAFFGALFAHKVVVVEAIRTLAEALRVVQVFLSHADDICKATETGRSLGRRRTGRAGIVTLESRNEAA